MKPNEQRIGVVGAGTMGNGIAHVFARAGFEVMLFEVDRAALDRGLAPPVDLEATHISTLEFVALEELQAHAAS